jgi:hypothetical protein
MWTKFYSCKKWVLQAVRGSINIVRTTSLTTLVCTECTVKRLLQTFTTSKCFMLDLSGIDMRSLLQHLRPTASSVSWTFGVD